MKQKSVRGTLSTGKWDHLILEMTPKDIAKFWSSVVKMRNGCWYRRSRIYKVKYSRIFTFKHKPHLISRVAWILVNNKLPSRRKEICHTCDHGPTYKYICINPSHIKARSHGWNMQDMHAKNRHPRFAGERNNKAKLCEFEVHQICIQYKNLTKKYVPKKVRSLLANKFKVSGSTIQRIVYKYKAGWRHVA